MYAVDEPMVFTLGDTALHAHLCYDIKDPLAVTALLLDKQQNVITWRLSRESLARGRFTSQGEEYGAVQIRPGDDGEVFIILTGDDGGTVATTELVFESADITRFLVKTFALVPFGGEEIDIDRIIKEISRERF